MKNKLLWVSLILLTASIFLFPVHLKFSTQFAQSTYIFKSLPLFAVVFIAWIVDLVWLFILNKNTWLRMALVGIFTLVFLGFWAFITPYGYFSDYDGGGLAYVQLIINHGLLLRNSINFGYLQFPLAPIIGVIVSKLTGLNIFNTRTLILLFNSAILGALLYYFFKNMLRNTTLAIIGAVFAIMGNMAIALKYNPTCEGLVLFAVFLALLVKGKGIIFESKWDKIIAIVLMLAITATHYITSFYGVAVLLGILVVQIFTREKLIRWWFVFVLAIIPLMWGIVIATPMALHMLGMSAQSIQSGVQSIVGSTTTLPVVTTTASNPFYLWWVKGMATSYLGFQTPLWTRMIIILWVVALFICGSILVLINLIRIKKVDKNIKILTGAMLGVFALSILAVLVSLDAGGDQFFRFLDFSGFFLVPIVLAFIITPKFPKVFIIGLSVLLIVLSFPTFLAYNSNIEAENIYPTEIQAGQYLQLKYGNGKGLTVYTDEQTLDMMMTYLPYAKYCTIAAGSSEGNYNVIVHQLDVMIATFNYDQDNRIFILSPRFEWSYTHTVGVSINDPEWTKLHNNFATNEEIYNNGFIQIYK